MKKAIYVNTNANTVHKIAKNLDEAGNNDGLSFPDVKESFC